MAEGHATDEKKTSDEFEFQSTSLRIDNLFEVPLSAASDRSPPPNEQLKIVLVEVISPEVLSKVLNHQKWLRDYPATDTINDPDDQFKLIRGMFFSHAS